ncbi:MAG: PDDEXK nuclease domain-containing protein [Elusimicrobia bacterium]|nr:PDDEXK nuclease domain-containing protein [Elusimicrobiota bacterium]
MKSNLVFDKEYKVWLADLKAKVRNAQIKAAVKVNSEMLSFYWELGADIVAKQANTKWGGGFLIQLSKDLTAEFSDMKGFSLRNLKYIKQWYQFYSRGNAISQQPVGLIGQQAVAQLPINRIIQKSVGQFVQQAVAQITQIPWGHNIAIITKCKNIKEAIYYVQKTITHNWSRSVLVHQIEWGLFKREGKAVNNFSLTLPKPQSDLAKQTLKDPYIFDFLRLTEEYNEKDMENALIEHIAKFLLELGTGFSYVGRQIPLRVGESEFYIDLLFYHIKLRCYIVIELKTVVFQPEFAGKLNFYITAVDRQLRSEFDQPTVGIIICKTKDKVVAEYALSDIHKPIGVSEYQLTHSLPKKFKSNLPTIKQIEKELSKSTNKIKK